MLNLFFVNCKFHENLYFLELLSSGRRLFAIYLKLLSNYGRIIHFLFLLILDFISNFNKIKIIFDLLRRKKIIFFVVVVFLFLTKGRKVNRFLFARENFQKIKD